MAEQDKISLALNEIGHCRDLRVNIADGKLTSIPAQKVFQVNRNGVITEKTIPEEIKK